MDKTSQGVHSRVFVGRCQASNKMNQSEVRKGQVVKCQMNIPKKERTSILLFGSFCDILLSQENGAGSLFLNYHFSSFFFYVDLFWIFLLLPYHCDRPRKLDSLEFGLLHAIWKTIMTMVKSRKTSDWTILEKTKDNQQLDSQLDKSFSISWNVENFLPKTLWKNIYIYI